MSIWKGLLKAETRAPSGCAGLVPVLRISEPFDGIAYLTEGTWVGVGVSTGPCWLTGADLMVVDCEEASGGSEATGTGLMRSVTIGLDRLTTVEVSQPQDSPPKSMKWLSHNE